MLRTFGRNNPAVLNGSISAATRSRKAATARGLGSAISSDRRCFARDVAVRMTLTAPGCGMGPVLVQDVQNKLLCLEGIDDVNVELVWDPPWNQGMMTEAARLQLGLM